MALNPEEYAFINRATGPYAITYWLMFLSALILPFTLLIKKLASKFWYVLLVAFAMKIAATLPKDKTILVNLSGRGDKDIDFVINNYPIPNSKF